MKYRIYLLIICCVLCVSCGKSQPIPQLHVEKGFAEETGIQVNEIYEMEPDEQLSEAPVSEEFSSDAEPSLPKHHGDGSVDQSMSMASEQEGVESIQQNGNEPDAIAPEDEIYYREGMGDLTEEDGDRPLLLIEEDIFLTQCTDVLTNPDEYMDYTIVLEGMYYHTGSAENDNLQHFVLRQHPGCCGDDGIIGFQLVYDGEIFEPATWVKVTGHLVQIDTLWNPVRLVVESIELPAERGLEFVVR